MSSIIYYVLFLNLISSMKFTAIANPVRRIASLFYSSISGRNLVVAGINSASGIKMKWNATGHIISATGIPVKMLEWLSQEYKFTYSYVQTNATTIEPAGANQKGLIDFVISGECDVLFPVAPTSSRIKVLEFTQPYIYIPVSYLIPFGNHFANFSAVFKPFQTLVWAGILVVTGLVTFLFYLTNKSSRLKILSIQDVGQMANINNNAMHVIPIYVLGVLLGQGGFCTSNRLPIRITAACWCLACLVFVNSYSSVLIAYLTLPVPNILINNIEELRERPEVRVVTDRGTNTEALLTSSDSGITKALGDKLRAYPKSRCNITQECLALVKSGSHVYTAGTDTYLYKGMRDDYLLTGECNFRLGKDSYMNLQLSWGLAKRSPLVENLSIGIMRMREFGLLKWWKDSNQADVSYCVYKAKERPVNPRLSVWHLTGAFAILCIGYFSSLVAFLFERRTYIRA